MRALPLFSLFALFVMMFGCAGPEEAPSAALPDETPEAPEGPAPEEPVTAPEAGPAEPPAETDEPEPPPAAPAGPLESEEITYSSFGWEIHGTVYPNDDPTKAVILVPMLGHTRDSYPQSFIDRLHDDPEMIVLAIDARGHGESTNLGTYEDFTKEDFRDMSSDIVRAKSYFDDNYPTVKEYYVVGASIGSTAAIYAGRQDNDITKIAMISPGMEYRDVNIESAAEDYVHKLFLAASSGDSYSTSAISEIKSISSSQVTSKIYSGSAHGTDMFDETSLETDLVEFLK